MRIKLLLGTLLLCQFLHSCTIIHQQDNRPLPIEETVEDKYENFDKFSARMHGLERTLGEKYNIPVHYFDVECIYDEQDLPELVKDILDFSNIAYKEVSFGLDTAEKQYFSKLEINNKVYEFRTSSLGDYVDLERVMPSLDSILVNNFPQYEYNFSNADGGQGATLIFVKSSVLRQAVQEGYPCSLSMGWANLEDYDWEQGLYTDVQLQHYPDFEELTLAFHQTLTELYKQGYDVHQWSLPRIYMDDVFKDNRLDIHIDGVFLSSATLMPQKIRCFWDSLGLILGYTLVKKYKGQPSLYSRDTEETTPITAQEYLTKVEQAFGKR